MSDSNLSPDSLFSQFDITDILRRLKLLTGIDKPPTPADIKGRYVWGRRAGGIHIEILETDDQLVGTAMQAITPEDQRTLPSKERWRLYCKTRADIGRYLNKQAVEANRYITLLKKDGRPTTRFNLLFAEWCAANYASLLFRTEPGA